MTPDLISHVPSQGVPSPLNGLSWSQWWVEEEQERGLRRNRKNLSIEQHGLLPPSKREIQPGVSDSTEIFKLQSLCMGGNGELHPCCQAWLALAPCPDSSLHLPAARPLQPTPSSLASQQFPPHPQSLIPSPQPLNLFILIQLHTQYELSKQKITRCNN